MRKSKIRTAWMLGAGIIASMSIAGCKNDIEPEKPPAKAIPGVATGSGSSGVDTRGGGSNPNAARQR